MAINMKDHRVPKSPSTKPPMPLSKDRVNLQPGPLTMSKNPRTGPTKPSIRLETPQSDGVRSSGLASSISPMSDQSRSPPSAGARLARSARSSPNLSSKFGLVSPISIQKHDHPLPLDTQSHSRNVSWETPSSSSSDDALDYASSCYSRTSSLTSMESEYLGHAYKSADAFSVDSPVAAGVFDGTESKNNSNNNNNNNSKNSIIIGQRTHKWKRLVKEPSMAEAKNKPLPQEPPIQMAPLSVRRNPATKQSTADNPPSAPSQPRQPGPSPSPGPPAAADANNQASLRPGSGTDTNTSDGPTLSQAAEDLENALLAYTTTPTAPNTPAETGQSNADSKHSHNASDNAASPRLLLDGPLQISRGDMQMIATRPAPRPPLNTLPHTALQQQHNKPAKNKMPFHLNVPGFGRKYGRLHLRSFSSSNMRSEVESSPLRDRGTPSDESQNDNNRNNSNNHETIVEESSDSSSSPDPMHRPLSISSERELRLKLPRLQTKKMQPAAGHLDTTTATVTASTPSNFTGNTADADSCTVGGPVKPIVEEKIFVSSSKMRRSNSFVLPYKLGSLRPPGIIYELDAGIPSPPVRVGKSSSSATVAWPVTLPDQAVRLIFEEVASLDDLFSLAVLNKQFYRIFKEHELEFIKSVVFKMSPPAWELREMSPPWDTEWQVLLDPDAQVPDYTPTRYLQRYAQDIFTLAQLKSLILARCGSFLRPDTMRGLAGVDFERATEVDDAFWRIWTFCRIFGCGKGRENDIAGQMDWLNGGVLAMNQHNSSSFSITEPFGMNNVLFEPPAGFGMGNQGGLSQSQMYDMTELFTCLSVLLQPIHGKCLEARKAGIFNGCDVKVGDGDKEEKTLEEWTSYVLTLGLSAVLSLGSICPIKDATTTFKKARAMGLTKWDLPDGEITRSSFLKDAVSKSYMVREEAASARQSLRSSGASATSSNSSIAQDDSSRSSVGSNSSDNTIQEHRVRQAAFAAELRNRRAQPPRNPAYTTFADERPISSYTIVMNGLDGVSRQPSRPPLHPMHISPTAAHVPCFDQPRVSLQYSPPTGPGPGPVYGPQVLDPVDRAIDMMIRELGFKETDAKWALKITDTGEGIDTDAAVSLLMRQRQNKSSKRGFRFSSPSSSRPNQGSLLSSVISEESTGWRWA